MPDADWKALIGQGGFVFFAVAMFAAIIYGCRWALNELVKPGFQMFREFLVGLTTQVERMADSNETTSATLKKLTDTNGNLQTMLGIVDGNVKELIDKLKRDSLEKPRTQ